METGNAKMLSRPLKPGGCARCLGSASLVAGLMVDALDQAADSGSREAALVHFVERVGADEAAALRRALAELEAKHEMPTSSGTSGTA